MAQERLIDLTTPLGAGVLLPTRVQFHDRLARVFELHLDAISKRDDLDANAVLGQGIGLTLELPDGKRHFHAIATQFSLVGVQGRYFHYRIEARPWLWLLSLQSDCQIFQQLSVPDILKKIFEDYPDIGVDFQLTGSYAPRDYCVQYRESDLDFVSRLMEEEGIYHFFKHTADKHILTIVDSASAHAPFPGYDTLRYRPPQSGVQAEAEHITEWRMTHNMHTGIITLDDYDFEKPSVELRVKREDPRDHREAKRELYDYPGEYLVKGQGEHLVRLRQEEQRARGVLIEAAGTARGLAVGCLFSLAGFMRSDQNREYLVLETEMNITDNPPESGILEPADFNCRFRAMPTTDPFRPERVTPRPVVRGPQTAIVVGPVGDEIYTDAHGRVKVQFHWDRDGKKDENSSCWMRVSHPWAGKGWGSVSIPRIGQEVIVDFLEGDPDQPIITGRVYNAECMPPFSLPGDGMVSGLKSNSTPGGGGYNEISANDTKGKEKITIHGQYDMNTTVKHDQTNTVNNKFTETIKSDATVKITEGKYSHDVVANVADYHVQGALTEKYDTTQKTTVKGEITVTSTAGPIAISSDTQHVYINAGTSIQLHVGASMIWMDSGGQIKIDGVNVTINGSSTVTIKGGIVHSEAASEHQTKGAIVLSDGSATNTVKGGVVLLNP